MKREELTYESIIKLAKYVTTFGQKTVEQEEKFKRLAEVIAAISPNGANLLEKKGLKMEKLSVQYEVARAQLLRLIPLIPREGQADRIEDLPRRWEYGYSVDVKAIDEEGKNIQG